MKENNKVKLFYSFCIGAVLGAIIFIVVYGIKVLDISNDDFLMSYHLDQTQHYVGWRLFRASSWHFPIGLCDTSIYPYMSSVVYTDSIPLFAVFFKILSPILPEKFQYFGIFGVICFMLQGGMAKLLLRKRIDNELVCNIGAIFFITNIVFVHRMFFQTALSAHFLILSAFVLFAYRNDIKSTKMKIVLWTLLGVLSISIHFYLYGMVSVLLCGFCLQESLNQLPHIKKVLYNVFCFIFVYLAATVLVFYILGGFYGTINVAELYENPAGADINALLEPMGCSSILINSSVKKLESFCYIGIAICILFLIAILYFKQRIVGFWKNKKKELVINIILFLLFVCFSLSPTIMLNDNQLFTITFIPQTIERLTWGLFRNCGRFMWPVMYMITYLAVVYSSKILKKAYPYVLSVLLLLQLFEFGGYMKKKHDIINSLGYRVCPADAFYSVDLSGIKHIQFMESFAWKDYYSSDNCFYQFVGYSRLAMDKGMTVSNFHFARDYNYVVQTQIEKCTKLLEEGNPDPDTMYVFSREYYDSNNLYGKYSNVQEVVTDWDVVLLPQ